MKLWVSLLILMLIPGIHAAQEPTDTLPPGFTRFFYANGKLSSEGIMVNEKPDGYWKSYYENGTLKSEGNRIDFQLDGPWKFYNSKGELRLVTNYRNGLKEGNRITYTEEERIEEYFEEDVKQGTAFYYDADNYLVKTIPYENGREQGFARFFNRDSVVITLMEYRKGVAVSREFINRYDQQNLPHGLWKTFYPDGLVREELSYKHGKLDGYCKKYDRDGNLETILKYSEGELVLDSDELTVFEIRRDYYPDMKVKIEGSYRDGVADGIRKEFNADGTLRVVYIIDMGRLTGEGMLDELGKKQGFWKEYFKEGGLKSEGNYKDGIRTGAWIFYFPSGSVEQKGFFNEKGKEDGKWVWYYADGTLRREEDYARGLRNGAMVEYDEQGKVIAEGNFEEGEEEGEWKYQEEGYRQEGTYAMGERDGDWKHYYPEGNISFSGNYIDGYPDGRHVYYNPDGTLKTEGSFIMGIRHGLWKFYSDEGVLILLVEYKNGVEMRYDNLLIKPALQGTDL